MGDVALTAARGAVASEDARLVARLAGGDELALAALYRRYGRYVYGLAFHMTWDAGAGEEITQDVFVRLWRSAGSYRPERASVETWIMRIARNRAIDELRRRRARGAQVVPSTDEGSMLAIADGKADVEGGIVDEERRGAVRAALGSLPVEQRQVIELAFFHGHTHTQIAGLLGEPVGTVKTRIRLGMQKLRGVLGDPGLEASGLDENHA